MGSNKANTDEDKNKKSISKIIETGKAALVLSWLVLLGFCLQLGLKSYDPNYVVWIYFLSIVLGSAYLLFSGAYIKNKINENAKNLLAINGFLSLLLVFGIIPILVAVMSFTSYFAYNKLKKINQLPNDAYNASTYPSKISIGLFVLVITILGYATSNYSNEYVLTQTTNYDSLASDTVVPADSWSNDNKQQIYNECITFK